MDEVEASVVVGRPPEEVYDLLFAYTNYPEHTPHLDDVTIRGTGAGTRFALTFSWWKLTYTARCRVTAVDPPERIEWAVGGGIDARGHWSLEPVPDPDPDRSGEGGATRARLYAEFDRADSRVRGLRLPPLVSVDWVLRRVRPLVRREAERLARGVIADVEGATRPVEVTVHERPDTV